MSPFQQREAMVTFVFMGVCVCVTVCVCVYVNVCIITVMEFLMIGINIDKHKLVPGSGVMSLSLPPLLSTLVKY